jgi:hypothetical protein
VVVRNKGDAHDKYRDTRVRIPRVQEETGCLNIF